MTPTSSGAARIHTVSANVGAVRVGGGVNNLWDRLRSTAPGWQAYFPSQVVAAKLQCVGMLMVLYDGSP